MGFDNAVMAGSEAKRIGQMMLSSGMVTAMGMPDQEKKAPEAKTNPAEMLNSDKDSIDSQIKSGRYIELNPSLAANYDEFKQLATKKGHTGPLRVVLDKFDDDRTPSTDLERSSDGTLTIRINSAAHEWTPQYARDYAAMKDGAVQEHFATGLWIKAEDAGVSKDLLDHVRNSAAKRGLPADLTVVVEGYNQESTVPGASAVETQSGKQYVTMNDAFVKSYAPEQQKAFADHELAHLQLRHTSPKSKAFEHNEERVGRFNALRRGLEVQADRAAVCSADSPSETAKHFSEALGVIVDKKVQAERKEHPDRSVEKIRRDVLTEETTHPALNTRMKDILTYPEGCKVAPLRTPSSSPSGASSPDRGK